MNLQPELSTDAVIFCSFLNRLESKKHIEENDCVREWKDKKWPKFSFSEVKQGQRRRQRERYRKMELYVSVIISQFQVILPAKCILSILE